MSNTNNAIGFWNQLTSGQRDCVVGGAVASGMMMAAASAIAIARHGAMVETPWGKMTVGQAENRRQLEELERRLALPCDSSKG